MNLCPCGARSDPGAKCSCSPQRLAAFRDKLSHALLDRFDLVVTVPRPRAGELAGPPGEGSEAVRERVLTARGRLGERALRRTVEADELLDRAVDRLPLSGRGRARRARRSHRGGRAFRETDYRASLEARGFRFVGRSDAAFSPLLRAIHDPPPGLFLRGRAPAELLRLPAVAIVGARSCSPYGAQVARSLARELAGLVVVSGLARGVDGHAHRGALDAGGLTVARRLDWNTVGTLRWRCVEFGGVKRSRTRSPTSGFSCKCAIRVIVGC